MTKHIDLDALQALAEKAGTEHPWHWHSDPIKGDPLERSRYEVTTLGRTITRTYYSDETAINEAAFIAAANPQAVSWMIARIRELEGRASSPPVDELANFIRSINGNHSMGAGTLAEHICEWLSRRADTGKSLMWTLNVFEGAPPEPHASWHNFLDECAKTGIFQGLTIRRSEAMDTGKSAEAGQEEGGGK